MSTPISAQLTGTFTSTGVVENITLPSGYDEFEMINITDIGSIAANTNVMTARGTSDMADGSGFFGPKTSGAATIALTVTPPPQTLTAINIDAKMDFYGTYILLNEQVTLQNQDPVLNEAAQRLGVSLRQTEDQLMRDMLASTASFINSVGGTNGDNPTEITRSDVDTVVRTLRGNNAYSFLAGVEGEDRFNEPDLYKSWVIDLELLAA